MTEPFTWGDLLPLLKGVVLTLELCVITATAGAVLGFGIGLGETSRIKVLRAACIAYVNVVRGIPLLVLIFAMYFGVPLAFPGFSPGGFVTAFIALTVWAAAYMAEIFRGSIEALPRGQLDAADSLGLSYWQRLWHVIFPQMLKIAFPSGLGFMLVMVKESSLISVIGYVELTKAGGIVSNLTGNPLLTYSIFGLFYFVVCYGVSRLGRRFELRDARRAAQWVAP